MIGDVTIFNEYAYLKKENEYLKQKLRQRQYQLHIPIENIAFLDEKKNNYAKKIAKENRDDIKRFLSIIQFLLDKHNKTIMFDNQISKRVFEYSKEELLKRENIILAKRLKEQDYQLHVPLECIIFNDVIKNEYVKEILITHNYEEIEKFLLYLSETNDEQVGIVHVTHHLKVGHRNIVYLVLAQTGHKVVVLRIC